MLPTTAAAGNESCPHLTAAFYRREQLVVSTWQVPAVPQEAPCPIQSHLFSLSRSGLFSPSALERMAPTLPAAPQAPRPAENVVTALAR